MSNPFELRYKILSDARQMLMDQQANHWNKELITAEMEKRPPNSVPLPTSDEILKLAESLYVFVKTKD